MMMITGDDSRSVEVSFVSNFEVRRCCSFHSLLFFFFVLNEGEKLVFSLAFCDTFNSLVV